MIEIKLDSPTRIVTRPEESKEFSTIKVDRYVDNGESVTAHFQEGLPSTILWEGEAFVTIGQWTNEDAEKRIKEIYAGKKK